MKTMTKAIMVKQMNSAMIRAVIMTCKTNDDDSGDDDTDNINDEDDNSDDDRDESSVGGDDSKYDKYNTLMTT